MTLDPMAFARRNHSGKDSILRWIVERGTQEVLAPMLACLVVGREGRNRRSVKEFFHLWMTARLTCRITVHTDSIGSKVGGSNFPIRFYQLSGLTSRNTQLSDKNSF